MASQSLLRIKSATKHYEERLVLREVSFRVQEGDRVGLIGRNGSGKTTLLKLLLGREEPDEGLVEQAPGVKVGYFSQFSELNDETSVQQVLEQVLHDLVDMENELGRIEGDLGGEHSPDALEKLLDRQAHLLEEMDRRDGWHWRNRVDTVLTKLGFDDDSRHRPLKELSGGWRNRAALAKILLEQPDVLLLDEPTNYLDIEGLSWLESWLTAFRGAVVLITHDRHFLDRVVNRIVEVENYRVQEYPDCASFAEYVRERRLRLKTLERQFEHEEEMLAYEAEAIAGRAEDAKDPSHALKRRLADIKKSVQPRPVDKIVTGIYQNLQFANVLCTVEQISKSYGEDVLFRNVSLALARGDRLAILGPNGCGKSTLLRVLTETEPPDDGRIAWGRNAAAVSFNDMLQTLEPDTLVAKAIHGHFGIVNNAPRKQVQRFLELMQFSEMDLKQKIGQLSGGQRARLALARCLLSGAAVIVLDEPTNHLDMTSTQVMERALVNFPGAVVVVSHDRFFIDKVATRLLLFEGQGKTRQVEGNWTIWQASRRP
jgi:ATP-binding cassette subfamily F protein 3